MFRSISTFRRFSPGSETDKWYIFINELGRIIKDRPAFFKYEQVKSTCGPRGRGVRAPSVRPGRTAPEETRARDWLEVVSLRVNERVLSFSPRPAVGTPRPLGHWSPDFTAAIWRRTESELNARGRKTSRCPGIRDRGVGSLVTVLEEHSVARSGGQRGCKTRGSCAQRRAGANHEACSYPQVRRLTAAFLTSLRLRAGSTRSVMAPCQGPCGLLNGPALLQALPSCAGPSLDVGS